MRSSQDFIKEKLNNLFGSIHGIKIRYEFREYLSAHLIEILPLDTFENNQEYILLEMEIQDEFESIYGINQEILFISSDSLNEIKDVQFSLGYEAVEENDLIRQLNLINHTFSYSGFEENITADYTSYALAA